jgi:3-oxoacyl-[acyl-carrier protein] reductase
MSRVVLVTGGGTGIGRAAAAAFAADSDRVLIVGRRVEPLRRAAAELGSEVCPLVCDLADPEQVEGLGEALPGSIDILVNGAGGNTDIDRPSPRDLRQVAAAWRANLDANLLSAVLTTTLIEARLAEGGAVVSVGSIAADKGAGAYGAAKAGLASWNVDLAAQLGPRGVTANVVVPGYIDTEFLRDRMTERRRQGLVEATMTGRPGTPGDIAGTVHFLASPAARQITGQVLAVNGGAWTSR